jgi:hypothetical protein
MKKLFILLFVFSITFSLMANEIGISNAQQKGPTIQYNPNNYPAPRQGGEDIGSAVVIGALPYNDTGTTSGYLNDYDEACPYTGSTSPDVVYAFTPTSDTTVDVTLCNGSAYDTKLFVYENAVTPGAPFACNDDECPGYVSELIGMTFVAGNTYYIVVDGYGGGSGAYVIDVTGVEIQDCLDPTHHTLTNPTGTSADLGWTANSGESLWNIEWGVTGFTQGTGTMITGTTTNPHSLTGLIEGTVYDWYVQADCGGLEGVSNWAGVYTFTSSPPPANDECVTAELIAGPFPQTVNGTTINSTVSCPGLLDWNDVWYEVTLPYVTNSVTLDMCGTTPANPSVGVVYYASCADVCDTYVIDYTADWELCGDSNPTLFYGDIVGPTTIFIPVMVNGTDHQDFTVTFDVIDATVACPAPTSPLTTNIAETSADLGWTEIATATTWDIELGISGFTPSGTPTYDNMSANPYSVSGLSAGVAYEWYVRAECNPFNNNTDVSEWVGPNSFATLAEAGTCGLWEVSLVDSYGDGWNGGLLDIYINGVAVYTGLTVATGAGPEVFNFAVDIGDIVSADYTEGSWASENEYTIYDEVSVAIAEQGLGGTIPGDVGDYTVPTGLEACPSCNAPSDQLVDNITSISADLIWTAGGSELLWNIEWGVTGFTLGEGTTVTGHTATTYSLTGLTDLVVYDWYVQADCDGSTSGWVGPNTFTAYDPLTNDECIDAEIIGEVVDYAFDTTNSTTSGVGTHSIVYDIWYVYTATGDGTMNVDLCGSTFDTKITVWDECDGTELAYNDDGCYGRALQSELDDIPVVSGEDYYIQVGGYGTYSGIGDITLEFIPTPLAPIFSITPDAFDFGSLGVGGTSAAQTFTIENIGVGILTIDPAISITGADAAEFTLIDINTYPVDLAVGETMTIDVTFDPVTEGAKVADLLITDNLTARIDNTVPLSGTGLPLGTCGTYTIRLIDDYGDGWNGGVVDVLVNGITVLTGLTIATGAGPEDYVFETDISDEITTDYTAGSYGYENVYYILNESGEEVGSDGVGGVEPTDITTPIVACPPVLQPDPPANVLVEVSSGTDEVVVSWDYVAGLEYTVYSDVDPYGDFTTVEGSGIAIGSLTISPIPAVDTFYKVTADHVSDVGTSKKIK